jgi:hypothetical protein
MEGRVLIIASYNGPRHHTFPASWLLRTQAKQLSKLRHSLDKVVIVVNESLDHPPPDWDYEEALKLFPNLLRRENNQGSYGGWRDAAIAYPDFEWYFFLEDDYMFNMDNFDQLMIDLWKSDTTYLAQRADNNFGHRKHASMSNGLTRGNVLKQVDWQRLPWIHQYSSDLQLGWSDVFNLNGEDGLQDITENYDTPFWALDQLVHSNASLPAVIVPVQMLEVVKE